MPYRLRCFGHILNLSATAFLFGHNVDAFENLLPDEDAPGREDFLLDEWRKKGAVVKLHNLVKFVSTDFPSTNGLPSLQIYPG